MNNFLKSKTEVNECSASISRQNLIPHRMACKNWDICSILPHVKDGNFLDMGCDDSYILQNIALLGIKGLKYGIDYRAKEGKVGEIEYFQGDLMHTPFQANMFEGISCLSVIEHGVDFNVFSKECMRLLSPKGSLFVTFDYWEPRIDTKATLYGLPWSILDKSDVERLVLVCHQQGLVLEGTIDWTTKDPVICPSYYGPPSVPVSYTFGSLMFKKA